MRATLTIVTLLCTSLSQAAWAPGAFAAEGPKKSTPSKKPKRQVIFTGSAVAASRLRADPLPRPSGHLELYSQNFKGETISVDLYNEDGSFNEASLDELYHLWRCRRTGTEKPINPHLFELLSLVYDRFQKPVELVSGFRNQERMSSYHFLGSAADIRVRGVSDRELHDFVMSLDTGEMGFGRYPRAGFIHIDVRPTSYRWIDRSPPSEDMGHPKKAKKRNA